jgi:hypothetical protein
VAPHFQQKNFLLPGEAHGASEAKQEKTVAYAAFGVGSFLPVSW